MKQYLIFLLALLPFLSSAQQPQYLGGPNTIIIVGGAFQPAQDTSSFAPTGSFAIKNGKIYVKGTNWGYIGTTTDTLTAKSNSSFSAIRGLNVTQSVGQSYYVTDAGKQGFFFYDPADASTADDGGTVLVDAASHRFKRIYTGAKNVQWFGAKGDGTTDDFAAIQAALNTGGTIYFPATSSFYRTSQMLRISVSGTRILGDSRKSKIIGDAGVKVILSNGYNVSNTTIEQMWLKNTSTSVSPHGCIFLTTLDSLFDHNETRIDTNIVIRDNYFTGPNGYIDAISLVAHRSGYGGTIRKVIIDNNTFEFMGSSAVGALGEYDTLWFKDIRFTNNVIRHMGILDPADGFGISVSGASWVYADNNKLTDIKTIGIECTVCDYSTISNNLFDSSSYTLTAPYTFNMQGTGVTRKGRGNVATGNRTIDSLPAPPYIINQDGFKSTSNVLKYYSTYHRFDSVYNSTFTGDTYIKTGANNFPVLAIRLHSTNNTFSQCNVVGTSSNDQIILFASNSTHNTVTNSRIEGNTDLGHLFGAEGTTSDNPITNCYAVFAGTGGYLANMPTASAPANGIVVDGTGNLALVPYGGVGSTYTPALTNTTNLSASSLIKAMWSRNNKNITVEISGQVTPTSTSGACVLTIDLPFTTSAAVNNAGHGMVAFPSIYNPGIVNIASTTTATFRFYAATSGSPVDFSATFTYTLP